MCVFVTSGECDFPPCNSCFLTRCEYNPYNNEILLNQNKECIYREYEDKNDDR